MTREAIGEFDLDRLGTLEALETEMSAFVAKRGDTLAEYQREYSSLRNTFSGVNQQLVKVCSYFRRRFPDQKRCEIISAFICQEMESLRQLKRVIEQRAQSGKGKRELARDLAQARLSVSKLQFDALLNNTKQARSALTTNTELVTKIEHALSTSDQPNMLYELFFELLPLHRQLMPTDVDENCLRFGEWETEKRSLRRRLLPRVGLRGARCFASRTHSLTISD